MAFDRKIIDEVLTHAMKQYLHMPRGRRDKSLLYNYVKVDPITKDVVAPSISRPTPSSSTQLVIRATIASETPKAFNFKVLLNGSRYAVDFPFTPVLFIWMPKTCCKRIEGEYYEVLKFMAMENLNKSLVTLKKKLIDSYGFESHEIIKIKEVHLL